MGELNVTVPADHPEGERIASEIYRDLRSRFGGTVKESERTESGDVTMTATLPGTIQAAQVDDWARGYPVEWNYDASNAADPGNRSVKGRSPGPNQNRQ